MSYEKPQIKSLDAGEVLRSIGPASAMISGVQQPVPHGGDSRLDSEKTLTRG